jgi:hypothetical protein
MSKQVVAVALLLAVGCGTDAATTRADLCSDLGHLAATVDDLARYGPDTRIALVRGSLEKMDPTFGALSRSELADPVVLDRLLRAHVGYRDLLIGIGDDEVVAVLGPAVSPAAAEFRSAFRATIADLACPG